MGWLFGSNKRPPAEASRHEKAHQRACRDLGVRHRWVDRKGEPVIEGSISSSKSGSRKGAIVLAAGALAGGGDAGGDWRDARKLAREAGMSDAELRREARRYT